jgi:hypothetical protein
MDAMLDQKTIDRPSLSFGRNPQSIISSTQITLRYPAVHLAICAGRRTIRPPRISLHDLM